jgi:hypothetical protein
MSECCLWRDGKCSPIPQAGKTDCLQIFLKKAGITLLIHPVKSPSLPLLCPGGRYCGWENVPVCKREGTVRIARN